MKTRIANLAIRSVVIAVGAGLFGAGSQGAPLASTQVQSAIDFQSLADSDLLILGPVDQVNPQSFQITLLGQTVVVPLTQHQLVANLTIGRLIAVYGSVESKGSLTVSRVKLLDTEYVPGATTLFIKGVVTSSDQTNAIVKLGSTSISYSDALHTLSTERVSVGTVISFGGLEFAGSSKFFADNGAVVTSRGQSGSDQLGQSGSDRAGQSGSDKAFSKLVGQSGSDQLGQSGSDTMGQSGSDKASSKLVGQSGSDQLGQSGSD